LVEASVADDAVPAGFREFASCFVRRSLSALALSPASRVAGRCSLLFRLAWGAEAEAPLVQGVVPDLIFFSPLIRFCSGFGSAAVRLCTHVAHGPFLVLYAYDMVSGAVLVICRLSRRCNLSVFKMFNIC
jgi:hypothetical protein